jgi:hypothetical protein
MENFYAKTFIQEHTERLNYYYRNPPNIVFDQKTYYTAKEVYQWTNS